MARLYSQHAKVDGTTVFSTARQREVDGTTAHSNTHLREIDVRDMLSHQHYYIDKIRELMVTAHIRTLSYGTSISKQQSLTGITTSTQYES